MNNKWVVVGATIVMLLAIGSLFRSCGKRETLPSLPAALKQLEQPDNNEEARAALLSIQNHGERALDQVVTLYNSAAPPAPIAPPPPAEDAEAPPSPPPARGSAEIQKAERRAFAVDALTSLPATPRVVEAIVEALGRETHPALKQGLADYLRQAAGMAFNDRQADGSVVDLGSDPAAWRDWWEREGRNMTTFHPPYGTESPANISP